MKKTIKQLIRKRKMKNVKLPKKEDEAGKIAKASISFIEGLKEVRRIAQAAGVESTFCATNYYEIGFTIRLKTIYQKGKRNTSSHSLTCGTCEIEFV